MIKKFLLLFISLFIYFIIVNIPLKATSLSVNEDKILLDLNINDNFKEDSVIISLSKQKSEFLIDFKSTYLAGYPDYSVKELTTNYSYGENRIFEVTIFPSGKQNVLNFIEEIQKHDDFIAVSPNYYLESAFSSDDNFANYEFETYENEYNTSIENVWEFVVGSSSVKVGILDTGISEHDDLIFNLIDGKNFINNQNENNTIDEDSHGTATAGIIGGFNNEVGMFGMCQEVSLVPLKFDGATSDVIEAIDYCKTEGIKIINMSFEHMPENPNLEIKIRDYNGLFVCCAGNDGLNLDDEENFTMPACFTLPNLITVGGLGRDNKKYSTSNYGYGSVDIYALGEDVLSTSVISKCQMNIQFSNGLKLCELKQEYYELYLEYSDPNTKIDFNGIEISGSPLLALQMINEVLNNTTDNPRTSTHCEDGYHMYSGTSIASPYVAGVAALLLSINPNIDIEDLKSVILDSADIVLIVVPDTSEGSNEGDMTEQSVKKLNAFNAVKEVLENYCSYTNYSLNNTNGVVNMSRNIPNDGEFHGLNNFFKLSVPYEKNYEFTLSSSYGINAILCDQNFNVISYEDLNSLNNKIEFNEYLSAGTYYLITNFTNELSSGDIIVQIKFPPTLNQGNNNIISGYSNNIYDYAYTNNSSTGFYKITLNATNSSGTIVYPDGCLKVYADESKQQLLTRLETIYYTLEAETQGDSNNIVVFLEYGESYYINIDLPNASYSSMNINIERLYNTYELIVDNSIEEHVILDENTTAYGDYIQRVEILQEGTYTISFIHEGPQYEGDVMEQENPLYLYYVFFKEVSAPAEQFDDLQLVIPDMATTRGCTVSFTFNLQPGIYYIGYYNKLNNQPMTISITS